MKCTLSAAYGQQASAHLSHCEPHIWHLIQDALWSQGSSPPVPDPPCPQFPKGLLSTVLPSLSASLSLGKLCECVCVGTTGTQPVGKSSTLPGWPSSGRACDSLFSIHKLYCTPPHFFFFTSVHTSSKTNLLMFHLHDWELVSAARLDLKNQTLYHKHRKQKHVCMFHRVALFRIFLLLKLRARSLPLTA